jgi:hypothetical protein
MEVFQSFQDSTIISASILLSTQMKSSVVKGFQGLVENLLAQSHGRGL